MPESTTDSEHDPEGIVTKILHTIFGEDEYCDHGTTALDGICTDCCNDEFGPDADVYEISDFR